MDRAVHLANYGRIIAIGNQKGGNKIGNTDPTSVPQESHGGNNARNAPKPQGKNGNGAQKRQQQKMTN